MVQVPRGKIFQRKDAEAQSKKSNALALRLCGFATSRWKFNLIALLSICNKRKFLRLHKLPGLKSPNELANRYKYAQRAGRVPFLAP